MNNQLDLTDIQDKLGYVDTGSVSEEIAAAPTAVVASSNTSDLTIKEPKPQIPYTAYTQPHQHPKYVNSEDDPEICICNKEKGKASTFLNGRNHQPQSGLSRFVPVNGNSNNNKKDQRNKPRVTSISLPATTMSSPKNMDGTQDVMVSKLNEIADMLRILTIQQQQQQASHTPSPAAARMTPPQQLQPMPSKSDGLRRKASKGKLPQSYYSGTPQHPSPERTRHNKSADEMTYQERALTEPPTTVPFAPQSYSYTTLPHAYTYATMASQQAIPAPHQRYYTTARSRKLAEIPYYEYNDDAENEENEDEQEMAHYREQLYDRLPYYHHQLPHPNYYHQQLIPPPVGAAPYQQYKMMELNDRLVLTDHHAVSSSSSEQKALRQRRKSLSNVHDSATTLPVQQYPVVPLQRKRSRKTSMSKKRPLSIHLYDQPTTHQYTAVQPPYGPTHTHYSVHVPPPPSHYARPHPQPHQYPPIEHNQYGYYM